MAGRRTAGSLVECIPNVQYRFGRYTSTMLRLADSSADSGFQNVDGYSCAVWSFIPCLLAFDYVVSL